MWGFPSCLSFTNVPTTYNIFRILDTPHILSSWFVQTSPILSEGLLHYITPFLLFLNRSVYSSPTKPLPSFVTLGTIPRWLSLILSTPFCSNFPDRPRPSSWKVWGNLIHKNQNMTSGTVRWLLEICSHSTKLSEKFFQRGRWDTSYLISPIWSSYFSVP